MDEIFRAVGSARRREILDRLFSSTGQSVHDLCARMGISRQAVDKQLSILIRAGLVVQIGAREHRRFYVDPVPIIRAGSRFFSKYRHKEYPLTYALTQALEQARRERVARRARDR